MRIINRFRTTGRPYFDCADFCHVGVWQDHGFCQHRRLHCQSGLPLPQLAAIAALLLVGGGFDGDRGLESALGRCRVYFTAMAAFIFHAYWAAPVEQSTKPNDPLHEKYFDDGRSVVCGGAHGGGALSLDKGNASK